jgi:tRNA pseudouridine55 synthase
LRDGVLNIDKPSGWTSHDVVAKLRTLLGVKKAGHAGTLDPAATGVLPVCFGRGTRIVEHLIGAEKEYRVVMRLGEETDTEDATGTVLRRAEKVEIDPARVKATLEEFVGDYDQVPPMYSAIKVKGLPMYKAARAGKNVERAPRRVRIHRILFEEIAGRDVRFTVCCSKGTYVRTLCADAGRRLSVGAHLLSLRRTRAGAFRVEEAVGLAEFEREVAEGGWQARVYPLDRVLGDLPKVRVDERWGEKVRHGAPVPLARLNDRLEEVEEGGWVRVSDFGGTLLALARIVRSGPAGPSLKIEKVLADPEPDALSAEVGIGEAF